MRYPARIEVARRTPELLKNIATKARIERVTRSPRAAAIGVATLSGLTEYLLETAIFVRVDCPAPPTVRLQQESRQ